MFGVNYNVSKIQNDFYEMMKQFYKSSDPIPSDSDSSESKDEHEKGLTIKEAAVSGAHMRFRAIMMTAIAALLGFLPLVISSGAGAMAGQAIGSSIFGGLFVSSFIGIFFIVLILLSLTAIVSKQTERMRFSSSLFLTWQSHQVSMDISHAAPVSPSRMEPHAQGIRANHVLASVPSG